MGEPSRTAMTKADLIGVVAKRLDITQVQAGIIVEAALRSIVSALQGGQEKGRHGVLRVFHNVDVRRSVAIRNRRSPRNPSSLRRRC